MGQYSYRGSISGASEFQRFPFQISDGELLLIDALKSINPTLQDWRLKRELNLIGLNEDYHYRYYHTLSQGEQSKAQIAALFAADQSFLLIDEPTNHLDVAGRKAIADYLNKKSGFIVISHDRTFLDSCIDHVLSLNRSTISLEKGNFSSFMCNKQYRDNFEMAENKKLVKQIAVLEQAVRQTAQWSDSVEKTKIGMGPTNRGYIGAKSAKMMQRSKAIENRKNEAIKQKSKLLKDVERTFPLKFWPLKYHKAVLAEAQNLQLGFSKTLNRAISFKLEQGQRLALLGTNGSGKSTLLRAIIGDYATGLKLKGRMNVAGDLIISYVSQDIAKLKGSLTAFLEESSVDEALFYSLLHKLGFDYQKTEKSIENYSDGQKKKILIARSLAQAAHLYIWDEPLNHIDIYSRIQIEQAILASEPTMLFVEHDASFVENVCTARLYLKSDIKIKI